MPSPDNQSSISRENILQIAIAHSLEQQSRSDKHLELLHDLRDRLKSVKDVAADLQQLLKTWEQLYAEKDTLSADALKQAIEQHIQNAVQLENELLELEAKQGAEEEAWWVEQDENIKAAVAKKNGPKGPEKRNAEALEKTVARAKELLKKSKEGQATAEYGRLKREVVRLVKELSGTIATPEKAVLKKLSVEGDEAASDFEITVNTYTKPSPEYGGKALRNVIAVQDVITIDGKKTA